MQEALVGLVFRWDLFNDQLQVALTITLDRVQVAFNFAAKLCFEPQVSHMQKHVLETQGAPECDMLYRR